MRFFSDLKSLSSLVCSAHHVALHEGGFGAERQADGTLAFFDPEGRRLDSAEPPTPLEPGDTIVRNASEARGLHIDHTTNLVQHDGVGLDLHAAVDALFALPQLRGEADALTR